MSKEKIEISFATPLRLEFGPKSSGRFTVKVGNLTFSGEHMSQTLQVGHYYTTSVQWFKKDETPATVDGATQWRSSNSAVVTCEVATGNSLIANCYTVAEGDAQVMAGADADLGEGVRPVTCIMDVTVQTEPVDPTEGEAVGGTMQFQDMGTGPPPPTKSK